jgi:DNA-binding GntR family transcriptional regulator
MELWPEMIDLKREKNPFLPLSDVIYEILFDHMLCFEIRPGDKLYESKIAEQLCVSRSPVAAAFHRLEEKGFLIWTKGKSARVAPFDPDDYYNVAYVRSSLERVGSVQACYHMTERRLDALRECDDELRQAWKNRNYYQLVQGEMRFHRMLIQYSENRYLVDAYDMILPKLMVYWGMMAYPSMLDNKSYSSEHSILLDAFEKNNMEIVRSTIKHHTKRPYLVSRDELLERQKYIFKNISDGKPIKNIYKK